MANRKISEERQAVYYLGIVLAVIGGLLFFSTFITGAMSFGDFNNFEERARSESLRAVIGFGLVAVGMILAAIGSQGLAGSGVVLDPEQAREDLEPWSRMAGGMVSDAVDEAGIDLGQLSKHNDGNSEMPFDEKLRRLHQLHAEGILTDEEYQREKQKILEQG